MIEFEVWVLRQYHVLSMSEQTEELMASTNAIGKEEA